MGGPDGEPVGVPVAEPVDGPLVGSPLVGELGLGVPEVSPQPVGFGRAVLAPIIAPAPYARPLTYTAPLHVPVWFSSVNVKLQDDCASTIWPTPTKVSACRVLTGARTPAADPGTYPRLAGCVTVRLITVALTELGLSIWTNTITCDESSTVTATELLSCSSVLTVVVSFPVGPGDVGSP